MKKAIAGVLALPLIVAALANWPTGSLPSGATVDRVIVDKSARSLTLLSNRQPIRTYSVSLGREPNGRKQREGDNRTPEGLYVIDFHKPNSAYHLALHVSYPDANDRARAAAIGAAPGGDIMIHGLPNRLPWLGRLHRLVDWTAGCIAVTNAEIEQIYRSVPDGTPIEIRG